MSEIARLGNSVISGLLLGAGRGTRLIPLTDVVPKPAVPLLDVPLGAYGLRMLADAGRMGVVLNVSHLGSVAAGALGPLSPGLEIFDEGASPLGTAGTLAALGDRLADPVVTVNGDLLSDLDLRDLLATHAALGAPATLAVARVTGGADFQGEKGRLTRFIDRRAGSGAPGYLYMGAAIFARRVVELIPEGRPVGLGEAVLRPLAARGDLAYHLHQGYARDVGTLPDYLEASLDVLEGRAPSFGAPGRILEVPGGLAYLGPGASAANGELGPGAIALEGALVEGRVRRAVVWPREHVPEGASIEGTIWFSNRPLPR